MPLPNPYQDTRSHLIVTTTMPVNCHPTQRSLGTTLACFQEGSATICQTEPPWVTRNQWLKGTILPLDQLKYADTKDKTSQFSVTQLKDKSNGIIWVRFLSRRSQFIDLSLKELKSPEAHFLVAEAVLSSLKTSSDSPGLAHKGKARQFDVGVCILNLMIPLQCEFDNPPPLPHFHLKQMESLYFPYNFMIHTPINQLTQQR